MKYVKSFASNDNFISLELPLAWKAIDHPVELTWGLV